MSKKSKKVESTSSLQLTVSSLSRHPSIRSFRSSYVQAYNADVNKILDLRRQMRALELIGNELVDVTPRKIKMDSHNAQFNELLAAVRQHFRERFHRTSSLASVESSRSGLSRVSGKSRASRMMMGGTKLSMEDILTGIGSTRLVFSADSGDLSSELPEPIAHKLPYVRVVLRRSAEFVLYAQRSGTAERGTQDGTDVEFDNKVYDHLTIGKGKVRRRSDADAQTDCILHKTRATNTAVRHSTDTGTYVSYYEMFDTFVKLAESKKTVLEVAESPNATANGPVSSLAIIGRSPLLGYASMVLRRLLASNEYKQGLIRYRNMVEPSRLDRNIEYRYTPRLLFQLVPKPIDFKTGEFRRRAVADISFCRGNRDILAVAYGIFSYTAQVSAQNGFVCIWNIKNPGDPERAYAYGVPIISVKFSPFVPSLIAIGAQDGTIIVRDITKLHDQPLAVSQRSTSPNCDPVIAMKWIKQTTSDDATEIEPFLSLSQDGSVTKYRIIRSPYLLGFKQMVLERVEGVPEGLPLKRAPHEGPQQANRHPQGLSFTMHPVHKDIYYLLTDEGCLHKCSTNYTHQYLEVWKAHEGAVNSMDFSPWSPKLFLTCGNDWCIRIWMDGIMKPLITLRDNHHPVHCAYWSRTHSTVVVALNRKTLDIWDISRNLLSPVSKTTLEKSFNTYAKFSRCGRSIAVGNERGAIHMCALDDFPFPPHFQYDALEKALFRGIATFPELIIELKSFGYFGYPKVTADQNPI